MSHGEQHTSDDVGEELFEWVTRGRMLVSDGRPAEAVVLLERALHAEPGSRAIREALARALFDSGSYAAATEQFGALVEADPTDDYAQYGLGLAAQRAGDLHRSVEALALAAAMRPEQMNYARALRTVRATLAARR